MAESGGGDVLCGPSAAGVCDGYKCISYNYNYVDSVIEVNGQFYIQKLKSILYHFNYVHCGVEMLNMSKIIMNKVFSKNTPPEND